ncbi:MAG: hypothetical protein HC933_10215 [Pleurocapsa sp. SU_196_0]|nr:hypothetical protein [Pleurocapsa sp. SU_196_0]
MQHNDGVEERLNLQSTKSEAWAPSLRFVDSQTAVLAVPNVAASDVTDVAAHRLILEAIQKGASRMILDLRFADGGSPFAAVKIAGAFMDVAGRVYRDKQGQTITYRYSKGISTYESSAQPGQKSEIPFKGSVAFWDKPLRVLINANTFSGLENIAAMLRHAKRTRLVGQASRGGGGVTANTVSLSSGTQLSVSTHRQNELDGEVATLKLLPDVEIPLRASELAQGRDEQLEAAIVDFQRSP